MTSISLSQNLTIERRIAAVIEAHRKLRQPVQTNYLGQNFSIYPGVFSPFIAPSGRIGLSFASQPDFQGKRVLDIGCGSGVIACIMALSGAQVVGVDINPVAVQNALDNARGMDLSDRTDFRVGNLFTPISPDESFDVILADLPFTDRHPNDSLEAAFFDASLKSIHKLVAQLPDRLKKPSARAYVCLSNMDGNDIPALILEHGLVHRDFIRIDLAWMELCLIEVSKEDT